MGLVVRPTAIDVERHFRERVNQCSSSLPTQCDAADSVDASQLNERVSSSACRRYHRRVRCWSALWSAGAIFPSAPWL